jgi:hypothetical protein
VRVPEEPYGRWVCLGGVEPPELECSQVGRVRDPLDDVADCGMATYGPAIGHRLGREALVWGVARVPRRRFLTVSLRAL